MLIIFEEKDRKEIEATGRSIIEAKRIMYFAIRYFTGCWKEFLDNARRMNAEQKRDLIEAMKKSEDLDAEVEQAIWRM